MGNFIFEQGYLSLGKAGESWVCACPPKEQMAAIETRFRQELLDNFPLKS